jgi:hypothetical protein
VWCWPLRAFADGLLLRRVGRFWVRRRASAERLRAGVERAADVVGGSECARLPSVHVAEPIAREVKRSVRLGEGFQRALEIAQALPHFNPNK